MLRRFIVLVLTGMCIQFVMCDFSQKQDNEQLVIVLLDETDSFGKDTERGIADSLYWNETLKYTKMIVKNLKPGDQFLVLGIDEKGFQEEDIRIKHQQLEKTFLKAKVRKNRLGRQVMQLKRRKERHTGTDILGGLYHAAYFANKAPERETLVFCFSDMRQEPKWPTLTEAKDLVFPKKSVGYFFFVDASGRTGWEKCITIWEPIFSHAGLDAKEQGTLNFFQYGESALKIQQILNQW